MRKKQTDVRPRHVAVVVYNFMPRGVQRTQIRLANQLVEMGYDVDVIVFSTSGELFYLLSKSVKLFDLNSRSSKGAFWGIVSYLWKRRPDIVFSAEDNVNVTFLMASLISPRAIKFSISCHVSPQLWARQNHKISKRNILKKMVALLYPVADQCVVLSAGMKDEYVKYVGLKASKMKVIYNPVQVQLRGGHDYGTENQHPWLANPDFSVIVGVGNLSPIKGFDVLIRAFSLVVNKGPYKLLIIGAGPSLGELTKLAEELGVSRHCEFVGYKNEPEYYLLRATLFVMSSRSEGFGNVLIEAMACGCPVVSTECGGGVIEILDNGRLGPIVPVGDPNKLSDAMLEVLVNPPDSKFLIESCERFRPDLIAMKYLEDLVDQ